MKINFLWSKFKAFGQRIPNSEFLGAFIEFDYLALIFLVPLWFAFFYSGFNIFELDKIIIFRVLLWMLMLLTSARILFFPPALIMSSSGRKNSFKYLKKYFTIPIILIAGLMITLFFSINPSATFFGSYERQEGISSYFFYFLWSLFLFFNLIAWGSKTSRYLSVKAKIRRILVVANISASLVAIYGILQILNIDFLTWPEPPYLTGRALSTLGQPNFFASFLLLTIPLAIYLAYSSRHFWSKTFFVFSAIFQVIGLFVTSSRGGLVALLLVVFLFITYLFYASKLKARVKWLITVGALVVFILAIMVSEAFNPGRLRESFNLGAGSFAARVNFFQASADAIVKKPIFGYGLENAGEVFIKYYDNDWGLYADVSANTDRAHNLILDTLLNSGFWGLLLISLWYYSFFKLAFLNYKLAANRNLALALAAAGLGYLFSLLFSFTIVAGEVYFWLLFALLAASHFDKENNEYQFIIFTKKNYFPTWLKISFLASFVFFSAWQVILNAKSLIADSYLNDIYIALGRGEPLTAIVLQNNIRSLKVNKVQMSFANHFLGDNLGVHLDEAPDMATTSIIKNELIKITNDLPDYGYQNVLLKAKIFSQLGDYSSADHYFSLEEKLAPNWPLLYLEKGRYFLRRGQLAAAEEAYKTVDTKLPDVNSPLINDRHKKIVQSYRYMMYTDLARAYLDQGNYERAAKFFMAAYRNMIEDYSLLKKIADTYYLRGDIDTAIRYVAHGAMLAPRDYNWQVALAELYYEKGDQADALASIEKAIQLSPDNQELEKLKTKYNN